MDKEDFYAWSNRYHRQQCSEKCVNVKFRLPCLVFFSHGTSSMSGKEPPIFDQVWVSILLDILYCWLGAPAAGPVFLTGLPNQDKEY